MGTVIVLIALGVIVALIIRSMIKDKKSGKSSCGGDCSRCRGCH
ncbi:MAG: FeoB-associated Cys-rich membrane protein [bacterium]|nr:FeoB-associated Cys-rich membrane protein [bacterium]MDY4098524.1 FeoB-associated Cys-rich membrane protein [Lachnospiraceae bacterium]